MKTIQLELGGPKLTREDLIRTGVIRPREHGGLTEIFQRFPYLEKPETLSNQDLVSLRSQIKDLREFEANGPWASRAPWDDQAIDHRGNIVSLDSWNRFLDWAG